jgi:hypothetical protein
MQAVPPSDVDGQVSSDKCIVFDESHDRSGGQGIDQLQRPSISTISAKPVCAAASPSSRAFTKGPN